MHKTASELDPEIDEFDFASLEKRDSSKVKVPRVAAALAAFECEVMQIHSLTSGPGAANIVVGRIVAFHVSDSLLNDDGQFNSRSLNTIGRMGDLDYSTTDVRFSI